MRLPRSNQLLLLVTLATLGLVMVYVPTKLVAIYESAQRLGPFWSTLYLASVIVGGLLMLGCSVWVVWRLSAATRKKKARRQRQSLNPSQLSDAQINRELDENFRLVDQLEHDLTIPFEMREELGPASEQLAEKRSDQRLEIVAFGTVSGGKSAVLNALAGRDVFSSQLRGGTTINRNEIPWPGSDSVTLVDTPGLGEIDGFERTSIASDAARDADLVLLVVDGPLRESEAYFVRQLADMEKRILIVLNKSDWYSAAERDALRRQLIEQTAGMVAPLDVVCVQAEVTERVRQVVRADGSEAEETVAVPADIQPLASRMLAVVRHDGRDLLLANLLLQSRGLVEQAKQRVQDALDRRALNIIDRYMWTAAGAAALSPYPVVDLAAGCAISSKMVVDLARVYRQDIDLAAAGRLLAQFGKTALGVLGAGAATPVLSSVVASLLKTVPGVGTVAGGLLQGVVQALITRWIGAIFVDYFKNEMNEPVGGIASLARRQWQRLTRVDELRKLVGTARQRLTTAASEPSSSTTTD